MWSYAWRLRSLQENVSERWLAALFCKNTAELVEDRFALRLLRRLALVAEDGGDSGDGGRHLGAKLGMYIIFIMEVVWG